MSSGVTTNGDALKEYQMLKQKKTYKFIIFRLNKEMTEIVVDKVSDKDQSYADFLELLPEDEPRYAVYDFEYETEDGGKRNKLVFISWIPDGARIKNKMVHASSKDALKRSLDIATEIQASEISEVEHSVVTTKVKSVSR